MPSRVAVYVVTGNVRSRKLSEYLSRGVAAAGDIPVLLRAEQYAGNTSEEIAVFYGYESRTPQIMSDFISTGRKVVFVDLGYWDRRLGGRFEGYHKVSVNARHPTAHFVGRARDRYRANGRERLIKSWTKGSKIIVAGMSRKAAESVGLQAEEWERAAIDTLRRYTDRPIIYRPKPSWREARPIAGVEYSIGRPIEAVLSDCHAVVTRHSNAALDGLLNGVPVFCEHGVASVLGLRDLSMIETPQYPESREGWLHDVAWTQFNAHEMRNGFMWRFLKDEGLI